MGRGSAQLARSSPMPQRRTRPRMAAQGDTDGPDDDGEALARRIVRERAGGKLAVCEACGSARSTDWAHRVARSHCGPWDPANGVHLCRACHSWTHGPEKAQARELGWILNSGDDFLTWPFKHWMHGWVILLSDGGFQYCDPP